MNGDNSIGKKNQDQLDILEEVENDLRRQSKNPKTFEKTDNEVTFRIYLLRG